ncbi:YkvI family membrane protein [Anaerotignum sp.]
MSILTSKKFQKYFVPGIVFQSCVIAGGYGTGRELVEYFMGYGPKGGILGMCIVSLLVWSIICAVSFAFAQIFKKYDYKSFMKELMGPGWVIFEIAYICFIVIVLAVVSASAGSILHELFGLNKWIGVIGMSVAVFALVMNGSSLIEKVLSAWSFVLYGVYFLFLVLVFANFSDQIAGNIASVPVTGNWVVGGFQYAFYNLAIIIAVLYTIKHSESTKDAAIAGIISGFIGILPGIILFIAMCGFYPVIIDQELPIDFILSQMNMPWLRYVFQIVLFGTLIETGSGLIYSITDRIDEAFKNKGRETPKWTTPVVAVVLLAGTTAISSFGLTGLIAKGYGTLAWVMFIVYVIPILTLGLYKIYKAKKI